VSRADLDVAIARLLSLVLEQTNSVDGQRAGYDSFGDQMPRPFARPVLQLEGSNVVTHVIHTPEVAHDPASIFYLHGGGYQLGSLRSHRAFLELLSSMTRTRVYFPEYRLAPEHRYPAAVDDSVAAYEAVLKSGVPTEDVVVVGDSAGGGLALATVLALRDRAGQLPAAVVAMSPWADLVGTGESRQSQRELDPMVQQAMLDDMASAYLGAVDPTTPYASPIHADFRDFPPLLLQVGQTEILRDDAVRVAQAAELAGVEVELEVWSEMTHVFQTFGPILPSGHEAFDALEHVAQFVAKRTGR
jgi:acetyl esterase/lipase